MAPKEVESSSKARVQELIKKGLDQEDLFVKPELLLRELIEYAAIEIHDAQLMVGADGEYVQIEVKMPDGEGTVNFGRPGEANLRLVAFFNIPKNKGTIVRNVRIKNKGRSYYLAPSDAKK